MGMTNRGFKFRCFHVQMSIPHLLSRGSAYWQAVDPGGGFAAEPNPVLTCYPLTHIFQKACPDSRIRCRMIENRWSPDLYPRDTANGYRVHSAISALIPCPASPFHFTQKFTNTPHEAVTRSLLICTLIWMLLYLNVWLIPKHLLKYFWSAAKNVIWWCFCNFVHKTPCRISHLET